MVGVCRAVPVRDRLPYVLGAGVPGRAPLDRPLRAAVRSGRDGAAAPRETSCCPGDAVVHESPRQAGRSAWLLATSLIGSSATIYLLGTL